MVDAGGKALVGLRFAVVDKDLVHDDLISVGFSDEGGRFWFGFTESQFNLDPFERETHPDLYILFSTRDGDRYRVVHRADFGHLKIKKGETDLGTIRIDTWSDGPVFLKGDPDPTPGCHANVRRLVFDHDLAVACLMEVAPLVESQFSVKGLLEEVDFEVGDDLSHAIRQLLPPAEEHLSDLAQALIEYLAGPFFRAFFDPLAGERGVVYVNRRALERQSLDGAKIELGRELARVAHFRANPDLVERWKDVISRLGEAKPRLENGGATSSPLSTASREELHELFDLAKEMDQATAAVMEELRRAYCWPDVLPHRSFLHRAAVFFATRIDDAEARAMLEALEEQYDRDLGPSLAG